MNGKALVETALAGMKDAERAAFDAASEARSVVSKYGLEYLGLARGDELESNGHRWRVVGARMQGDAVVPFAFLIGEDGVTGTLELSKWHKWTKAQMAEEEMVKESGAGRHA